MTSTRMCGIPASEAVVEWLADDQPSKAIKVICSVRGSKPDVVLGRYLLQVENVELKCPVVRATDRRAQEREGRLLSSDELVHHVDRDPLNNNPDNLVILSRTEHQRLHTQGVKKIRWSAEETQRAQDLRAAGMNLQEISQVIGRPFSSTSRRLAEKRK